MQAAVLDFAAAHCRSSSMGLGEFVDALLQEGSLSELTEGQQTLLMHALADLLPALSGRRQEDVLLMATSRLTGGGQLCPMAASLAPSHFERSEAIALYATKRGSIAGSANITAAVWAGIRSSCQTMLASKLGPALLAAVTRLFAALPSPPKLLLGETLTLDGEEQTRESPPLTSSERIIWQAALTCLRCLSCEQVGVLPTDFPGSQQGIYIPILLPQDINVCGR